MTQKPRGLQPHAWAITRVVRNFLHQLVRWRLFNVQAVGRENIPREGAAIIAPNHLSLADPVVAWGSLPRTTVAVAMKELWKTPLVVLLWLLGHIAVDRTDRKSGIRAYEKMQHVVNAGGTLLIFPEGKCSRDGAVLPFKSGAAKLAYESRVPIIPVGIAGTDAAWSLGTRRIRRREPIVVIYGEALVPADYSSVDELNGALHDEVVRLRGQAITRLRGE